MPSIISLVLRWSGAETIPEHQAILNQNAHVWWGWWNKEWEAVDPKRLLDAQKKARQGGLNIGLVNRKDDKLYIATCVDIAYDKEGRRIGCPEKSACPSYYNQEANGAWFKIISLVEIQPPMYEREFGQYPVGDPTLYDVIERHGERVLVPAPTWSVEPLDVPGDTVLHISDLHFGDDHGFEVGQRVEGFAPRRRTLNDAVLGVIDEADADVGVVVVSGDVTTFGNTDGFADADRFLTQLARDLSLEKRHVVLVPGNHDFLQVVPERNPKTDYRHEAGYRMFVRAFYGEDDKDLERLHRFSFPSGWDVTFMALNSARLRAEGIAEYGYVGQHRYEQMLAYAKTRIGPFSLRDKRIGMAVLHHHVVPVYPRDEVPAKRGVSLTLDAGQLCNNFQIAGLTAVLHGHQHLPFVGSHGRVVMRGRNWQPWSPVSETLHILGAGSAGAARLPDVAPLNSLNLYRLAERSIDVTAWGYTADGDSENVKLFSVELPISIGVTSDAEV